MQSRGQGATEYLVLLAVVLVIALVGIALLGFFPGTASDAQETESKIYWQSQSPIAIVEGASRGHTAVPYSWPYLRVRNTGGYPIRITKLLAGSQSISEVNNALVGNRNISEYFYLAPGEEKAFGYYSFWGFPASMDRAIFFYKGASGSSGAYLYGAASVCSNNPNSTSFGFDVVNSFGFEYAQYVEGQEITKRQIGTKPLILRCKDPYIA